MTFRGAPKSVGQAHEELVIEAIEEMMNRGPHLTGVKTNIPRLDSIYANPQQRLGSTSSRSQIAGA